MRAGIGRTLRHLVLLLLAGVAGLTAMPAAAHKPSDSYLVVDAGHGSTLQVRWDIALRDLDYALALDADHDGRITWGEVRARQDEIDRYALGHLSLSVDGQPCRLTPQQHRADQHSDGAYLVTDFTSDCASGGSRLSIAYRLFFDLDPMHRGLLRLRSGQATRTAVLGPEQPLRVFELARPDFLAQLREYFRHGVWHIWQGLDHVLFLLSLLLPSVLQRRNAGWQAAPALRGCLVDILRVVTAFTVAHSITLSLAALGVVALPSRLVESTIAASVLVAALNNLRPVVGEGRWRVAFLFGLIHGFGFASVLNDLGLPRQALVGALVGFNLGVEAGQLAIVLLFIPLAWPWRAGSVYRRGVVGLGSLLVALLAAVWLVERVFEIRLLPFTV
ncbi:MAG: HupE/UreJ family protein [Pseudomonadota bacterium]|nr:HupE/UreJ family protein [Pseudomonadota bacterium]